MFEFHANKKKYFDINVATTTEYILPFIEQKLSLQKGMRVLDFGCGEGGVLQPFLDKGLTGVGLELDKTRLEDAVIYLADYVATDQVRFVSEDIYTSGIASYWDDQKFDLIILKDVIEHIYDQQRMIAHLKTFLRPGGCIFFGFPPWYMPFGGHQQILKNKYLSKIPYYHLLPMPVYKKILQIAKENVQEMVEIKETGISIERFEKIVLQYGFDIAAKRHFLLNPIYKYKFGTKPRTQLGVIQRIPFFRNFITTCVYYLIQKKEY